MYINLSNKFHETIEITNNYSKNNAVFQDVNIEKSDEGYVEVF